MLCFYRHLADLLKPYYILQFAPLASFRLISQGR